MLEGQLLHLRNWLLQNKFLTGLIVLHLVGYWMIVSNGADNRWNIIFINIVVWGVSLGLPIAIWKWRLYDLYLNERFLVGFWLFLIAGYNFLLSADFSGSWKVVLINGGGWASVFLIAYFVGRYRQDSALVKWFGRVFFGILALLIAALIITKFLLAAK